MRSIRRYGLQLGEKPCGHLPGETFTGMPTPCTPYVLGSPRPASTAIQQEDVPLVVELRDGGPGVMVRRWSVAASWAEVEVAV